MLRWVLVIYLVLVTAAGPGLCCCSALHLFAGKDAQPVGCAGSPEVPGCCRPASSRQGQPTDRAAHSPDDKDSSDGQDRPHKRQCPCRQHDAKHVALAARAPEVSGQAQDAFQLPPAAPTAGLHALLPADSASPSPGNPPPPFCTAQDLLQVHHRLRC